MPSNPPSIRLAPATAPIPTTAPNLMPFHMEYTGPIPMSTYFLAKPVPSELSINESLVQRLKMRFVASFRGRRIRGLKVDLPDGFSGVVLHSADQGREEEHRQPLTKGRQSTRKSKKDSILENGNGDGMGIGQDEEAGAIKTLRPAAKFASFILWNADVNVDEETDEYLLFLTEYQRLSAEIHRIP